LDGTEVVGPLLGNCVEENVGNSDGPWLGVSVGIGARAGLGVGLGDGLGVGGGIGAGLGGRLGAAVGVAEPRLGIVVGALVGALDGARDGAKESPTPVGTLVIGALVGCAAVDDGVVGGKDGCGVLGPTFGDRDGARVGILDGTPVGAKLSKDHAAPTTSATVLPPPSPHNTTKSAQLSGIEAAGWHCP